MGESSHFRRKIRQLYVIIAVGFSLGIVFVTFSDGFNDVFYFINGASIGILIALIAGTMELFVFHRHFREIKFYKTFLIRVFFYIILVFSVTFTEMVVARMIRDGASFNQALGSEDFMLMLDSGEFLIANIYILFMILGFNFTRQMNRKLGHGVLMNFITGKYYNPRYVSRIVLFMRIIHSDAIIEKIGRLKFHQFIKDLMMDMSGPILRNKGMIYEYIEDEVVITWKYNKGTENGHCIRTFFEAKETIYELMEMYYSKYNFVPKIKAALNYGQLVQGELGDIKCEVVLTGDVMNATARILGLCVDSEEDILITRQLANKMKMPVIYSFETYGNVKVKGKEEPLELLTVKETVLESI